MVYDDSIMYIVSRTMYIVQYHTVCRTLSMKFEEVGIGKEI